MLAKVLRKPLNKMTGKEGIKGSGNGMTKGTKGAICHGKDSHDFFVSLDMVLAKWWHI